MYIYIETWTQRQLHLMSMKVCKHELPSILYFD